MFKIKKILLICFILTCCSDYLWAQEVSIEGENGGIITLSVTEHKIRKKKAIDRAVQDAFFQLMFRGVPGSAEYSRPLLGTDENTQSSRRQYYDNLINSGRAYTFINYSNLNRYYYYRREAIVVLSINVQALTTDLESKNIYRRFGLQ